MNALQFRRFILDSIPVAMVTMYAEFEITPFNGWAWRTAPAVPDVI